MSLEPFNIGTILSLLVGALVAYNQWRLIRANRRKVLAEGSDLSTQAADRMLTHWEADNRRLRDRLDLLERRCDEMEDLLREHGIPVPPLGTA